MCLAAALYMLAGQTDSVMQTFEERLFSSAFMLIGNLLAAFMVSQFSVIMAQAFASQRAHQHKLDMVSITMRKIGLPGKLARRVLQYYNYLWHTYGSFDLENRTISDLSPSLMAEIHLFQHREMIQKVPFFAKCSINVIQAVVNKLQPEVYLESDFVLRVGDPGYAMYFIARGQCAVLVPVPNAAHIMRKVKTLQKDDYFGEISLLAEGAMSTTHVLAETVVDLNALSRSAFAQIRESHPELLVQMHKAIGPLALGSTRGDTQAEVSAAESTTLTHLSVKTDFSPRLIQAIVSAVQPLTFQPDEARQAWIQMMAPHLTNTER